MAKSIFEFPGQKQTYTDFKPAPDEIRTSFGTLNFELGAFPTEETIGPIFDEMDLQRATQAYMDFYPALSQYAIVKSQIRDFGFSTSSDIAVAAGPGWKPSEPFLTGNNSTVYAIASLDLKVDGPTVVEIPPGMMGTANDALFKFLVDFGFVGPDEGQGGKYLIVGPDYDGPLPDQLAQHFLRSLADQAGLTLHVQVIRGEDEHHIVEATFKALGLALRQALASGDTVFSTKGAVEIDRSEH